MVKKILPIILVLVAAFFAGFALLHPGLPPTHDGEYHVIRFFEFNKTLLDGNFYPRWAPDLNNGFGLPLFNYVYPLPNYVASAIHLFGTSFIDSFKLEMFFSLLLGSLFFYLWSKEFWGKMGGVVSAVFYTFTPYHFVDVYIRGSVGEVLALAILPALAWSLTVYIKTGKKIFFPLSALLFALLILSHNILALMFLIFILSYVTFLLFLQSNRKKLSLELLGIVTLGLMLSSIFWLPALLETKLVVGLQIYDVTTNFPQLYQLLIPSWGSGFSSENFADQLSFQIGLANLLVILLSCLVVFSRKKDNKKYLVLFFVVWFLLVFFLMLQESVFVWKAVPLMNYFQFPWRFLSLEMVITSFLAGGIVYFGRAKPVIATFLILISFLLGIGYAKPAYYLNRDDNYYMTRSNFIDGTNSPGDAFNTVWFNSALKKQSRKLVFIKGSGDIFNLKTKDSGYFFSINAKQNSQILVNTSYFPGWNIYIDNIKTETIRTDDGLFAFNPPSGKHDVKIRFEDTVVRKIASIISVAGLFLLTGLWFGRIKRRA